jgi:predicted nucleic acid-binding protein
MISTQDNEYAVVLDACVLVPMPLCDTLLRLAEEPALYRPLWSEEILREVADTLEKKLHRTPPQRERRISSMRDAFPEAMVKVPDDLVQAIKGMPDLDDRHLVAAAIRGSANAIITANTKHFPAECLGEYDLICQTPDEFLVHLFHFVPEQVLEKLDAQAANIGEKRSFIVEGLRSMTPGFSKLIDR